MKNQLNANHISRLVVKLALTLGLALPLPALASSLTLATSPLVSSSTSVVSPNMMFMLDDSGSMAWDYMPDNAKDFAGYYGFNSSQCNGVYYNPQTTYTPPVDSTGTAYPNSSFTGAPVDGYAYQSGTNTTTVNLNTGFTGGSGSGNSGYTNYSGPAFYYNYTGTQTQPYQILYQPTSSVFYKECISAIGSTTKVDGTHPVNTVFNKVGLTSTLPTSTITVIPPGGGGITINGITSKVLVGSITVNGVQIYSNSSASTTTSTTTLATNIAKGINNCTSAKVSPCTTTGGTGFSATVSGNSVAIFGPSTAGGYSPVICYSGSCSGQGTMTYTVTPFPTVASTYVSGINVNGIQIMLSGNAPSGTTGTTSPTTLASALATAINATGYLATASGNVVTVTGNSSSALYTPVITTVPASGGLTLTATQFPFTSPPSVLQNFANWYTYYSNRMLMMKTGVGLAFAPIGSNYRVGFMTMNNNVPPDYVDIAPFTGGCAAGSGLCQKDLWYTTLYASTPANSTPLREALSRVGQLYAHKLGAYTTYTATIKVSGTAATTVTGITVNGGQIMAGTATPSNNTTTVASSVAQQINIPVVSNYGASSSGSTITITSGLSTDAGTYPVVSDDSGGMTYAITSFAANTVTAKVNGVVPADPIQYSCQQNFVILSTDGYWNGASTYDLNNNPVGEQDGLVARPMYDGAPFTVTTSQTTQRQAQTLQTTTQILSKTTQLQSQTTQLKKSTSQILQSTKQILQSTSQLTGTTSTLQGTVAKELMRCAHTTSTCGTAPSNGVPTSNWTVVTSCTTGTNNQCAVVSPSSPVQNVSSKCNTAATISASSPYTATNSDGGYVYSSCYYTAGTATGVASCTTVNPAGNPNNTTQLTATSCNTVTTGPTPVASCTAATAGSGNSYTTTTCPTPVTTGPTPVASCTAATAGSGNSYTTTTCPTPVTTGPTSVASCTPAAASTGNSYITTTCPTNITSSYANASSCTATTTPNASGQTTQCQQLCNGQAEATPFSCSAFVGASSCTAGTNSSGQQVTCWNPNPVVTGPQPVLTCTQGTSSCAAPFTSSSCITTSCTTNTIQIPTPVPSCTQGNSGSPNYINTYCTTTPLSTSTNAASCTPSTGSAPNYFATSCSSAPCSTIGGTSSNPSTACGGGTANTLADVAMYYWQTDLRDSSLSNCNGGVSSTFPSGNPDVCDNDVSTTTPDNQTQQHMTTYTVGIGVRGAMVYSSSNYTNDTSGDFYSVKTGAKADSTQTPPICSWQANGTTCNWPVPVWSSNTNVDDLWHAAVDGHGVYYSATNPQALATGLGNALSSITARKGAAAAAATSTLNPVAGNNYAYVASYTTVQWTGNLEARTINTTNGVVSQDDTWCVESVPADTCAAPGIAVPSSSGNSTVWNCVTPGATSSTCSWPNVFDPVALTCAVPLATACTGTNSTMVGPSSDIRKIYTANSTGTALIPFDYTYATANPSLSANVNLLSQWGSLTGPASTAGTQQNTAANPTNLINYLRGQFQYDNRATNLIANQLYRNRLATLGDALESQPAFIAAPTFSYADTGYSAFLTANASRPGMVYMGTNDGMLHAFYAQNVPATGSTCVPGTVAGQYCGGQEAWAYVPSVVIPNMYKLADFNYSTQHVNYVNGSPIIADYYCTVNCGGPGGAPSWRTMMVAGLNDGGREFYAIDITVPSSPTLLWEFTPANDPNLGYSYGQPVVTKLANGQWVVLVTSGYDNGSVSGDGVTAYPAATAGNGRGYLYVLDAQSGAIVKTISTGAGTAASPSGLAKIAAWNNDSSSNQASYVYGGDLLGNVWRFDINAGTAFLFATLADASGNRQPVTTTPALGLIQNQRVVFVGTGSYLQVADLTNPKVQSLYAISDNNATATLNNPRLSVTAPMMVQQTITGTGSLRTGSLNAVDFSVDRGWYVDFPDTGERVNVDPELELGTLLVPTIVPSNTACSPGGYGYLNYFNYLNGQPVPGTTANTIVSQMFQSPLVGMNILYIQGSPIVEVVTSSNPTPTIPSNQVPFSAGTSTFAGKRMQWRELIP